MSALTQQEQEFVDAMTRVYLSIQSCPDGPAAGRAAASALFAQEDEQRGTAYAPMIERFLGRVEVAMSEHG